ncbi:hypothetical protein HELRODRAFT_168853 [Helobdella robusta]|uniref:Uncharacterized protein n=1 Tax=Helobdella robusta TaxID=6412 RepID=T1F116_HELRO|nr:hypothetical protein HELRODRAFT_168853 [Helobdella robusta]ESO08932.1 hypothetical protein HELRODRAFT_168853 [Helobdella robusta]
MKKRRDILYFKMFKKFTVSHILEMKTTFQLNSSKQQQQQICKNIQVTDLIQNNNQVLSTISLFPRHKNITYGNVILMEDIFTLKIHIKTFKKPAHCYTFTVIDAEKKTNDNMLDDEVGDYSEEDLVDRQVGDNADVELADDGRPSHKVYALSIPFQGSFQGYSPFTTLR